MNITLTDEQATLLREFLEATWAIFCLHVDDDIVADEIYVALGGEVE